MPFSSICCFNSIKVQLEPQGWTRENVALLRFQFHKGSIRTRFGYVNKNDDYSQFQFHKGSIRTLHVFHPDVYSCRVFQFHKGSIRTVVVWNVLLSIRMKFQFHKGSIRTINACIENNQLPTFQFHKGSIRTSWHWRLECLFESFNSIKVQLELIIRAKKRGLPSVSIP